MALLIPSKALWGAAKTAENLTAAQTRDAAAVVRPLLSSIVRWLGEPDQLAGINEEAMKAAWAELQPLSDAQVRAVMRVVASYADADFIA